MTEKQTIAVLGIGLMGGPMARNLLNAGYEVRVWNRSLAKAQALATAGATVCATAAEAAKGAEIVISMLADGYVVQEILEATDMQATLTAGVIWIDMSSTKPDHARAQSAVLKTLGCQHLDAPVSGGTKGAEQATLAIMAGGTPETFAKAKNVLNALGRPVHVGPCGTGQLSKLANQTIVAVAISAVAEAMLLLQRGGADPAAVRDALKGGFADSTILQQHGARMTNGDFEPGGPSKLQVKDLDNALAEAASLNLNLPATQSVRDRFAHFCDALDGADKDHSGLYLELLDRNGGTV